MKRTTHWVRAIGLVVVAGLLLASCGKANGGGWLQSATGAGKATFSFNAKCRDTVVNGRPDAVVSGQLEYKDAPAGVQFHGVVSSTIEGSSCAELSSESEATFVGSYRPKPTGETGTFFLSVQDNGEPGIQGDVFCISLLDGAHDGYSNCGPIGGGNIQVH
jgi:hypothetical protein